MIQNLRTYLGKLKASEDGNVVVEFVLIFPVFMFFILSAMEYAVVTVQQSMLERAVDITVREIRLGTGTNPDHDTIKDSICENTLLVRNCSRNLRLEMIQQSAFAGVNLPETVDCTDNTEEVRPVRTFQNGLSNELMILRACARVDPLFPTSAMGRALVDDTGQIALTATTAFVQEPS
ncbi:MULTISPECIES: TadE family protein [Ruegeria]|uniref:TadE/TadG family type IV pilus assembly protein n=1 Tax=Ruegeria TaxID=97050 RepID=UPI00147F4D05|nr:MULTISPECIES: TadE family protein [Ruegeria]MBO9412946.1 pilus assembly protein [Ruegeria sp. R8_1]MBO9416507.1 pilus assembly protein [Ruegeria sp. R8_2]